MPIQDNKPSKETQDAFMKMTTEEKIEFVLGGGKEFDKTLSMIHENIHPKWAGEIIAKGTTPEK